MKRFQVVKAAHVVFAAAAVLLIAVIVILAVRYVQAADTAQPAGNFASEAAQAAFSVSQMKIEVVRDDAGQTPDASAAAQPENEHTDTTASAPAPKIRPSVLIYHTHTHEAYQQTESDRYEESYDKWRTADNAHNVVCVGDALAAALEAEGVTVVHDVTDHEQEDFETAYERSLETLQQYEGMDFDLYIDLHRDAYGTDPEDAVTVSVDQTTMAKLMLLVGTGEGFAVRPDATGNYKFALELTERINALTPGLCRDVLVKSKRYNQHMGRCILLEVGHNLNTLDEALATVPYAARAIAGLLLEDEDTLVALSGE